MFTKNMLISIRTSLTMSLKLLPQYPHQNTKRNQLQTKDKNNKCKNLWYFNSLKMSFANLQEK